MRVFLKLPICMSDTCGRAADLPAERPQLITRWLISRGGQGLQPASQPTRLELDVAGEELNIYNNKFGTN